MRKKYIEHKYGKNFGLSKRDKRRIALEIEEYEFKNLSIAEQKELSDYITKSRIFPEPNWKEIIKSGVSLELIIGIKAIYSYSPTKISKISDTISHRLYFEKLKHFYEYALIYTSDNEIKILPTGNIFQEFLNSYIANFSKNFLILTDYYNKRNTKYEKHNLVQGTDFVSTLSEWYVNQN